MLSVCKALGHVEKLLLSYTGSCGSVHVEVGRIAHVGHLTWSAQFPTAIAQNAAGLVTFCSSRFYICCYFWKRPPPSPTPSFHSLTLQSTGTPE